MTFTGENHMSDEPKKQSELESAGEEKQLDEKALDEVVGGDTATPNLLQYCCNGKHFPTATLE
jgi:type VI protein secretion system component Hcp